MLTESIRLQLGGTSVKVVELEPPSVRTALLPGQQDIEFAMPLEEFTTELVALLESEPDATEIQVERVKFLRYGEPRGAYDQVVKTLNASDPHRSWGRPAHRRRHHRRRSGYEAGTAAGRQHLDAEAE